MLYNNQKDEELKLVPLREESLDALPSCCKHFEHCITREEKSSNVANDTKLYQNLNAILEFTNSIGDLRFEPFFVLEVLNLTDHLNIITKERAESSQWESFTEEYNESKLNNKLHIIVNNFCIAFF